MESDYLYLQKKKNFFVAKYKMFNQQPRDFFYKKSKTPKFFLLYRLQNHATLETDLEHMNTYKTMAFEEP